MKQKLLQNLFGYERKETVGEIFFFRFFELFVIYWALLYAWDWGPYLSRLKDVVLPLGEGIRRLASMWPEADCRERKEQALVGTGREHSYDCGPVSESRDQMCSRI